MSQQGLDRFRALFAEEAETRLGRLNQLLLEIEAADPPPDAIGEIFREVHTLKGAAAVVGFDDLSAYAHVLEEQLEELRAGRRVLDLAVVDSLLAAVDGLAQLISASLTNEDAAELARAIGPPLLDRVAAPAPRAAERVAVATHAPAAARPTPPEAAAPAARTTGPAEARAPSDVRATIQVSVERLDELVRLVGEAASANLRVGRLVHERLGPEATSATELVSLSRLLNELQERAMRTRMVPITTITDQLRRAVRDLARTLGKDVRWEVQGEDTELDRSVLQQLADSLLHVVRNAVDHGIESPEEREHAGKPSFGTVQLHAMQFGSEVTIAVIDDGRGIDVDRVRAKAARQGFDVDDLTDDEALQLVFRSGISTAPSVTDISGRGVGLDVVRASVEAARGRIEIHSERGVGTEMRLMVPTTLAVMRCLVVQADDQRFALPMHRVVVARDGAAATTHAEGRRIIWVGDEPVTVTALGDVLGHPGQAAPTGPIVVVNGTLQRHAFQVDSLVGQRDAVVKGLSGVLPRIDVVAGTSVEPDGSVLVVLDPPGLVERARNSTTKGSKAQMSDADRVRPHHILVVDDALTVRELQRSILERAGYTVSVAGDGVDALGRLAEGDVDLVLTDVEMPRMDGFALTRAIRERPPIANLPVLILTSLSSEEDRQKGLDAGADGYIIKSAFDERALLQAVDGALGAGR